MSEITTIGLDFAEDGILAPSECRTRRLVSENCANCCSKPCSGETCFTTGRTHDCKRPLCDAYKIGLYPCYC